MFICAQIYNENTFKIFCPKMAADLLLPEARH